METEGDALLCAAISSSGECLAFGGSGGYVHLWATSPDPSINQMRQVRSAAAAAAGAAAAAAAGWFCCCWRVSAAAGAAAAAAALHPISLASSRPQPAAPPVSRSPAQPLEPPEPHTPLVSLGEDDPLSQAPTYFPQDASGLLSDVPAYESVAVGLPPRVVDASLMKSMRQASREGCGRWMPSNCWRVAARTTVCRQRAVRSPHSHRPALAAHLMHVRYRALPGPSSVQSAGYIQYPHALRPPSLPPLCSLILWGTSKTRTTSGGLPTAPPAALQPRSATSACSRGRGWPSRVRWVWGVPAWRGWWAGYEWAPARWALGRAAGGVKAYGSLPTVRYRSLASHSEAARAERARRRAEAGGAVLPGRYKRVQIRAQQVGGGRTQQEAALLARSAAVVRIAAWVCRCARPSCEATWLGPCF